MKTLYTLIVYTPGEQSWTDRYGDRHDGKDSDLQIRYFNETERNELIQSYGYEKFNNPDAEIKLLINGHDANDFHDSLSDEEEKKLTLHLDSLEALAHEVYAKLKTNKEQKDKEAAARKLQEQEAIRLREKKRQEDSEKAELARLMAKYN
jgi:hypothetical protein